MKKPSRSGLDTVKKGQDVVKKWQDMLNSHNIS